MKKSLLVLSTATLLAACGAGNSGVSATKDDQAAVTSLTCSYSFLEGEDQHRTVMTFTFPNVLSAHEKIVWNRTSTDPYSGHVTSTDTASYPVSGSPIVDAAAGKITILTASARDAQVGTTKYVVSDLDSDSPSLSWTIHYAGDTWITEISAATCTKN